MKRQKFFIKLFMAYILIAFVYTSIVASLFFYKNNQMIEMELNNQNQTFLEQTKEQIDTKLMIATNFVNQLRLNDFVIEHGRAMNFNYYNTVQVFKELNTNQNAFSDLGYTLGITKMTDNLMITPFVTTDINRYFNELGIKKEDQQQIRDFFQKDNNIQTSLIIYSVKNEKENTTQIPFDGPLVTIVKKTRLITNQELLTLLTFSNKFLVPKLERYDQEGFIILKKDDIITMKTGFEKEIFDSLVEKSLPIIQEQELDYREKNHKFEISDQVVYHMPSDIMEDWYYVYITPKNALSNKIGNLILDSIMIYFFLTLIGVGLAFFIAQKTYKPIKNIVNSFKIYGSNEGKDEFSFIEETTENIRKANESLRETIYNSRLPLKIKFLRDLLYGLLSREQIKENIDRYELGYLEGECISIILEFVNYQDLNENYSKEAIMTIKDQILVILKEQVKKDIQCEIFELNYKRYAIIMDETEIAKIKKFINTTLSSIEDHFELTMTAAIGEAVDSIYEIEDSFNIALTVLEQRAVTDKKAIITMDDIKKLETESYYYPLDMERSLISYVIRGKKEEATAILTRILDRNLNEKAINKEIISEFIFALVGTINRILQQLNTTAEEFFDEGKMIYIELKMCDDEQQLKDKVLEIFESIIGKINCDTEETDHSFADQMIEFIQQNYTNANLSLTDIAEYFNLSPAYISRIFKAHTGENFKDFLNIQRVNKAKEILNEQDIKIKELAEMVGFNHSNTFIRIFKKYEGISPGQYGKDQE